MIINTTLFGSGLTGAVKIPVSIPRQNGTLTYNSSEQSPVWMNYDESVIDISGNIEEVNAGEYTSTFSLKDVENYVWEDGSDDSKPVNWSIGRAVVSQNPTQNGTLYYTGSPISANFNYNENEVTPVNVTSKTNVGTYYTDFVPTDNYKWSNDSVDAKSFPWTISRAIISTIPSQSGTLTYSGYSQTPTWNNYNSSQLTLNVTSQINAGTYTATFTPTSNYQWSGGSISAKSVSWKINKASQTISVNTQYITLTDSHTSETIYVSGLKGNVVGVGSTGSTIYDCVSIDNSNPSAIVVTAKKNTNGTDSFYILGYNTTNYNNSNIVTIYVTVSIGGGGGNVGSSLNNTSWDNIKELADNGTFANYFSVGDTKEITLNGRIGNLGYNLTNLKVNVFVIGINHNAEQEGENLVHFQCGKIDGKIISFIDMRYENYDGSIGLQMHAGDNSTNAGGWQATDMYYWILEKKDQYSTFQYTFQSVLPKELQDVLSPATKYTDNVGGGAGHININVTPTQESISLISEYELFGKIEYSNLYEASYQAQYDYYYSGNDKRHYKYNSTSELVQTWVRSPAANSSGSFCSIYYTNSERVPSVVSLGISPIFFV